MTEAAGETRISPTPDQSRAIAAFRAFVDDPTRRVFTLRGYAGTGKTSIARLMVDEVLETLHGRSAYGPARVCVAAPTARAATVLRRRGFPKAATIHSLIYMPRTVKTKDRRTGKTSTTVTFNLDHESSPLRRASLLVLDEASMIGSQVAQDLLSFDVKILVIGDPFQLPPVTSDGNGRGHPFRDATADVTLTEVVRQARESPVLEIATRIRNGEDLPFGWYGDSLVWRQGADLSNAGLDDARMQVVVGKNDTRRTFNERQRAALGRGSWLPERGDRVICRENDSKRGMVNGECWTVGRVSPCLDGESLPLELWGDEEEDDGRGDPLDVTAWTHGFRGAAGERTLDGMPWRRRRQHAKLLYGYALTAHNAQGSEWPEILVFDEGHVFGRDRDRWLYTAVTRASERVVILR